MSTTSGNKSKDTSQLDWLWTTFNPYTVSNSPSEDPSETILLTEKAISELVKSYTGITSLTFEENAEDASMMDLIGTAADGTVMTVVEIPKEEHIICFAIRNINQYDVDCGCPYAAGKQALVISTNLGNTYWVSCEDIDSRLTCTETNTVYAEIVNNILTANVKIDKISNEASAIPIKVDKYGIYNDLKIDDENSGVHLEVGENGLTANIPMGDSGDSLKFTRISLDDYMLLTPVDGTVYFITDAPYIYLNGVKYGVKNYEDLKGFAEYIEHQVLLAGFSLVREGENVTLYSGHGYPLSTVSISNDNYLMFAEQRAATEEDVVEAAAKGVTLTVGEPILILTLSDDDKVFISLSELTSVYKGVESNSTSVNITDYQISTEVKISDEDKMLEITETGLKGNISVRQAGTTISIYGRERTTECLLDSFRVPYSLLGYMILSDITEEDVEKYPPKEIDGVEYDPDTNPISLGEDYLVIKMGTEEWDSYYLYVSISKLTKVSKLEDNLITKDEDGDLYASLSWNDVI